MIWRIFWKYLTFSRTIFFSFIVIITLYVIFVNTKLQVTKWQSHFKTSNFFSTHTPVFFCSFHIQNKYLTGMMDYVKTWIFLLCIYIKKEGLSSPIVLVICSWLKIQFKSRHPLATSKANFWRYKVRLTKVV